MSVIDDIRAPARVSWRAREFKAVTAQSESVIFQMMALAHEGCLCMLETARVLVCTRVRFGMRCIACAQAAEVRRFSCACVLVCVHDYGFACISLLARPYARLRLESSHVTRKERGVISIPAPA